jgi:hypothetical protein
MSVNFRVIAKLCFLLVIIGFCMPMACDGNGFDIASSGATEPEFLGPLFMYGLFVAAIIGFIIGIILLLKKYIPIIIDWIVVIICISFGLIMFFAGLSEGYGEYYQSGTYMIIVGYVLIFIFQAISAIKKEK